MHLVTFIPTNAYELMEKYYEPRRELETFRHFAPIRRTKRHSEERRYKKNSKIVREARHVLPRALLRSDVVGSRQDLMCENQGEKERNELRGERSRRTFWEGETRSGCARETPSAPVRRDRFVPRSS